VGRLQAQRQACCNEEHFVAHSRHGLIEPALFIPKDPRGGIDGDDAGANFIGDYDDLGGNCTERIEEVSPLATPYLLIGAVEAWWPQAI
jgi:hypothetical protein